MTRRPYRLAPYDAEMTCPRCSSPLTHSTQEPATAGGTLLVLARCSNARCGFVMIGADPAVSGRMGVDDRFDAALFAGYAFDPDARITLDVRRPTNLNLYEWGPTDSPPVYIDHDGQRFTLGLDGERHPAP